MIAGGESSYARLSNSRPIVMTHGKGTRFWDVDGNEYLDWCLGYGPMIFGHCPERINRAVIEQIPNAAPCTRSRMNSTTRSAVR